MKRVALMLLAVGMLTTACGHPLIPAAAYRPAHHTGAHAKAPAARPVLGINVYALHNFPLAQVQADARRVLAYVKDTLRASAVDIVWDLYQVGYRSNQVVPSTNTLPAGKVAVVAKTARELGLKVELRPIVVVLDEPNSWEGLITPSKPAMWFASYFQAELPYLRVAQALGVQAFVASTEMHKLSTSPLWAGLFEKMHTVYHGNITYASWDGDYFPPAQHLLPALSVGVDFYERMPSLPATASIAQVTAAWATYFRRVPNSVLERTTIQEMGIAASPNAHREPANLGLTGPADPELQARWFAAACNIVHQFDLRGIFFWKVDLSDYPMTPATSLSTFEGRSAARAIANCAALFG